MALLDVDIQTTAEEAETMMFMMLRMAARFFENTDLNVKDRIPEGEFSTSAIQAWIDAMEALYPADEG